MIISTGPHMLLTILFTFTESPYVTKKSSSIEPAVPDASPSGLAFTLSVTKSTSTSLYYGNSAGFAVVKSYSSSFSPSLSSSRLEVCPDVCLGGQLLEIPCSHSSTMWETSILSKYSILTFVSKLSSLSN
jgi:hypothetical protein